MNKFNIGDTVRVVGYSARWDGREFVIDNISEDDQPFYCDSDGYGFPASNLELVTPATPEWKRGDELRRKDDHSCVRTYWGDHPKPEMFMYRYGDSVAIGYRKDWEPVPTTVTVTVELTREEAEAFINPEVSRLARKASDEFVRACRKAVEA